jgi:hypothetical protein
MFKFIWNEQLGCYCAEHNTTIRADKNGNVFGGGSTKVSNPTPPAATTSADATQQWYNNLDKVYQAQLKYAPLEAQQSVELAQQYAQPYGEALQKAQEAMYPGTSAIQEKLAGQALSGMDSEVPDWMRTEYLSNLNANLGSNVGSGIGADYVSRGLLQQKQDWQSYYQNLGLSVSGRQPLTQASTPQTSNYMSSYTPATNMNYLSSTYSPYASAYSSMYGTNAQSASQGNPYANAAMGIVGMGVGGFMGNSGLFK